MNRTKSSDIVSRWQTFHSKPRRSGPGPMISRLVRVSDKRTGKTLFGNVPEGVYSNEELTKRTHLIENQLKKSLLDS